MSRAPSQPQRILALCSATQTASVALLEGEQVLAEHTAVTARHQSESLLPLVDRVLRERGIAVADLDGFGISIGPGSFTSLRIGLATLKGLAFGAASPVAPVSTLWALAASQHLGPLDGGEAEVPIVAMLNAQRGEVYAAAFDSGPAIQPLSGLLPELVYDAGELCEVLPARCLLVGGGASVVGDSLVSRLGSGIRIAPEPAEPSAGAVGVLAARILARGEGVEAADLAPRYVRRAEAEVTRTSQRFEAPGG